MSKKTKEDIKKWESNYKSQRIDKIRDEVQEELYVSYQDEVEKERIRLQKEAQAEIDAYYSQAKEEAEQAINQQIEVLQVEMDRHLENQKVIIRAECLEELRSAREQELVKKIRTQLTKKMSTEIKGELLQKYEGDFSGELRMQIEQEMYQKIRDEVEKDKRLDRAKSREKQEKEIVRVKQQTEICFEE